MDGSEITYNRGAVKPMQCLREGWQLIKADYWQFLGISLVGVLIGSAAPLAILAGPMMCGIYMCLLARWHGQPASMNLLFRGFNHFAPSLIATLLMVAPMMVVMVPMQIGIVITMFATMPQPGQGQAGPPNFLPLFALIGVMWLVIMVMSLVLGVLFFFTYPLIVDRQLSGMQAVRVSFKAAFANFGGIVGLMILTMLMSMVGMLFCYVGAIFLMPIHFAAVVVAYRQVFPAQAALDEYEQSEPSPDAPRPDAFPRTEIQEQVRRDQIQ